MKTKGRNTHTYKFCLAVLAICTLIYPVGCKKLAEVDPLFTSISTENVYKDDATASAVFIGLYARISSQFFNGGLASLSIFMDLSADNLSLYDLNSNRYITRYYKNDLEQGYTDEGSTYWQTNYQLLYTINDAIARLANNNYLTPQVTKRLLGEAYFLRAFCYFHLVNLYGDVPLILKTDPGVNSKMARTAMSDVYLQMNNDLLNAGQLLTQDYVPADVNMKTIERLRPNLAAINALQARIYLYQKKYPEAEAAATKVISQSAYSLTDLTGTFQKNSSETIWALQTVTYGFNTLASKYLLIPDAGPDGGDYNFLLTSSLLESFEVGDQRKVEWVKYVEKDGTKYYYPTKYVTPVVAGSTSIQEYNIVLRLAEQYLIRAEARNEQNNTEGAIADLNTLREKRRASVTNDVPKPLPVIPAGTTQSQLRAIILRERRSELFTEWGHRWFDLKRTGTINAVMTEEAKNKNSIWSPYKALFPIPSREILINRSIIQNTGYIN